MKRMILIPALFAAMSGFAQSQCSNGALFRFDNAGTPREVTTLGSSPEFPFIRTLSTPDQVAAALKKNGQKDTKQARELNDLLTGIGFSNGARDLTADNISRATIPQGTEGNMGSAGARTEYSRLDAANTRAWKVTGPNGCYVYLLARCGNAFYPKTEKKTACINVPVNIGGTKEVTLNNSGKLASNSNNTFIYYHRKRGNKLKNVLGINDPNPSKPLLLTSTRSMRAIPETYKITVNSADNTVTVCPDSTLKLSANINVERESGYSGYYAKDRREYKKVSKHRYMRVARKLRKIDKKEEKIADISGVKINQENRVAKK